MNCLRVCTGCPSSRVAQIDRYEPIGDVAIVVDFPTDQDAVKGDFLQGDSGTLAQMVLQAAGVDLESAYYTTALNCRPNPKKEAMMKKAMLGCRERLVKELQQAGVKKVLTLGSVGFSALMSAERVLPSTKVRGRWYQAYGMDILPTINPTMVMGDPDRFRDFYKDVEKFATTPGKQPWPNVVLHIPETIKEMREAFRFLAEASFVSLDVETTGFSAFKDELLAVGLGVLYEGGEDALTIVLDEALLERTATWKELGSLLARGDQDTVLHNAKFDLKFLKYWLDEFGITYDPKRIQDTMLLNYLLDERPMGKYQAHSLKNMARVRHDAPDYDINMKKWIEEWKKADEYARRALRKKMHTYLGLDCYYTAVMYPHLVQEVEEESHDLMELYNTLLMPGTYALVEIEMHGAKVDRAFFEATWDNLQARAAPILERIQSTILDPEFNPNSPKQVHDYLYDDAGLPKMRTARRGKLQEGPTSKQVLKMLKKKFPEYDELITDILEYRNLTKNAGTYVKGILERMDDDDRIRCDFFVHGTSTGRLSSTNPNLQNIPEASHTKVEVRNGYIAPDGYLLGNADYSQLELRIAAHLSGDKEFIQVYVEDRDLHQEVAFEFFRKPKDEITSYERYMAKCMNFGVVYGRGAHSLAFGPEMEYIEDELGGNRWSQEEVEGFFDKFFGKFSGFKEWMDEQYALGYSDQVVVSPLGRRRRFPFIPRKDNGAVGRQAVNTPIQGTASDFTFASLIRIHARFKELNVREDAPVAFIVLTVHDSIMFEFLPAYIDEVRAIVREEMEDNVPLDSVVPFKSDFEAAPRWGEIKGFDYEAYMMEMEAA